MHLCIEERGQASVEAAFVLPVLFCIMMFLLQPVCLFYARSVMQSCAGEVARIVAASTQAPRAADVEAFAKRRLAAIPEIPIFHTGGPDAWHVAWKADDDGKTCAVEISGEADPVPLFSVFAAPLLTDGKIELKVEAQEALRPEWLEGDYHAWISAWD